jgi:hypothetical protein
MIWSSSFEDLNHYFEFYINLKHQNKYIVLLTLYDFGMRICVIIRWQLKARLVVVRNHHINSFLAHQLLSYIIALQERSPHICLVNKNIVYYIPEMIMASLVKIVTFGLTFNFPRNCFSQSWYFVLSLVRDAVYTCRKYRQLREKVSSNYQCFVVVLMMTMTMMMMMMMINT